MEAYEPFDGVATNAALKLHVDGVSVDEAREYVMQLGPHLREAGRAT